MKKITKLFFCYILFVFFSATAVAALAIETPAFSLKGFDKQASRFDSIWKKAIKYQNKAISKNRNKNDYIIGGRLANKQEFPSVVALIDESGRAFCTGNLIAPDIIATAGHCVLNLFYKESPDFKILSDKLNQPLKTSTLSDISTAIESVVIENKKNIHVRVLGENHFNLVQAIGVSKSWAEWNTDVAQYYLTGKRDIRYTGSNVTDKAIIRLNRKFSEVEIQVIISQQEMLAVKKGQYKKAIQVGYGYIKDPSIIEKNSETKEAAKIKLQALMDKKYIVELPVNTIFSGKEGLRAGIGKPGKAACYGDSGGPTFVQLNNGQWRYFASLSKSISKSGLCGENDENAWQSTASEQKKQTTDISDVWVL